MSYKKAIADKDGGTTVDFTAEESLAQDSLEAAREVELIEREKVRYKIQRSNEYPEIGDQLDDLYHAGMFSAEMSAQLKAIKDKYPKK